MIETAFRVPQHGLRYLNEIKDRCSDLIAAGIWAGIKPDRLRRWTKNFTTDEERYFAACLLDSLMYRSEDQVTALARISHQLSGIGFEGAESGDCSLTLSR